MEFGFKPTLIPDGVQDVTTIDRMEKFSLIVQDAQNDFDAAGSESDPPTAVEENKPTGEGQQKENELPLEYRPSLPLPQTITIEHEISNHNNFEFLGLENSGYVYKCPGGFAYKTQSSDREVDFMKAAGDCSITPICRVMDRVEDRNGVLVPWGVIMELATPYNFKLVAPEERKAVMDEMVGLVERLHSEFGIVHGDIKPANFLRCDGKLRLCDFDSARFIADETTEGWEGFFSDRYLAPSRGFPDVGPPTVIDNNYGLAISVWELFTGKDALIGEDFEDILPKGKTVDLTELEDDGVRDFVRKRLREGGAKV
ncbi:hypothetical protein VTI28DRAFT_6456 [Corynascus sepedonium]